MIPTFNDMTSKASYANMEAGRTARSTSIDVNAFGSSAGPSPRPLQAAFEKLSRRTKSVSGPIVSTPKYEHKLVWRERKSEQQSRRTRNIVIAAILTVLVVYSAYSSLTTPSNSTSSPLASLRRISKSSSFTKSSSSCNPFAVSGNFHVDYSEPSNNYWEPEEKGCTAPRYMQQLRDGDYESLSWLQNKTIILFGDSIERDHVTLFCSLLGKEAEVIKGNHKFAVTGGGGSHDNNGSAKHPEERQKLKKDRSRRIALKGMQESTLPRICFIEELNFMMANLYHFGLDEQDFWKGLDSFHPPGAVEERLQAHIDPFIMKLQQDGRTSAPDLIEVSSGMYDLARWAKQDIAAHKSTEEPLTDDRMKWYRGRMNGVMDAVQKSYPKAVKTWRATTQPEDQAQELDYFNDRFGHSPATIPPHFHPDRVQQIDSVARDLVKPYLPTTATKQSSNKKAPYHNKALTQDFVYSAWASLIRGTPAHQLDRLHGGDLATPGTVLWSDVILWHLKQKVAPGN